MSNYKFDCVHAKASGLYAVGGWRISAAEDADGHLLLFVMHNDGSQVIPMQQDLGDSNEWATRFTSAGIEHIYQHQPKGKQ